MTGISHREYRRSRKMVERHTGRNREELAVLWFFGLGQLKRCSLARSLAKNEIQLIAS